LFVIVSNPVELAVKVFSEKLGRERVIGMGAEQDSLRFARAIAHDLYISRQYVMAAVLGEHGQAMVPVWSSVQLKSTDQRLSNELALMKERSATLPLAEREESERVESEVRQKLCAGLSDRGMQSEGRFPRWSESCSHAGEAGQRGLFVQQKA
jgi:malate dehydrogenase